MRGSRKSTLSKIAAIVAIVAVQALVINYLGRNNYLPEGSEHWTEDWLIHYFSPRLDKPYKAIAIVTVDPESLEKAGLPSVPPADRAWMAKLVTAVSKAGALAIGVDFYFTTPTKPEKDEALVKAIRDSKAPVVIAAVSERYLQTEGQRKFLAEFIQRVGGRAGHIGFKRAKEIFSLGDRADRAVYHDDPEQPYPSLSAALTMLPEVRAAFGSHKIPEGQQRVDWLLDSTGDKQPFLHYSAYEVLSPEAGAPAPDLNGKIVLIGPDFAALDQHTLPFTVGKEKLTFFPGVTIHAQAVAQILDGRFFYSWSATEQFFLLFVIGLLGTAAGWPFHEMRWDFLVGIAGSLLIIGLSVPFFMMRMPFPTALAIIAWGASIWTGQKIQAWRN
jgi:CHASE2 domain-containing sensor protein